MPFMWFLVESMSHLEETLEKGKKFLQKCPKKIYCEDQISETVKTVFPTADIKKTFYLLIKVSGIQGWK